MEMAAEREVGVIYTGTVVKVRDCGGFVNLFGKRDGLVNVSQMANERVNHTSDLVKEGQKVSAGDVLARLPKETSKNKDFDKYNTFEIDNLLSFELIILLFLTRITNEAIISPKKKDQTFSSETEKKKSNILDVVK